MKHQIAILGKEILSVYHGLKEFGPDRVHFICTEETRELPARILSLLPSSVEHRIYMVEPYNPKSVAEVCEKIHAENEGSFSYNLSEGTKLMTFGAYQIVQKYQSEAFYLTQQREIVWLDTFEKTTTNSILNNDEILQLSGNYLAEYNNVKDLKADDVRASMDIKNFIEQYPKEHAKLQKFFGVYCRRDLINLPSSQVFPNELRYKQNEGALYVYKGNQPLLTIPRTNGCHLYFEGRWWETLVADQVRQWSERQPSPREVWQSVIFQTGKDNTRTKNEIDVLLNNEMNLVFIECKSGYVSQNDIYKIDAVRETYGGDISQAVLASYYPLASDLRDKCKDLQIDLFAPLTAEERVDFIHTLPDRLDEWSHDLII